ncbi:MAG: hypothetical protein LBV49_02080 [Azonexus sp.]|jgi:hypothetical protein|nr:hypothetical protein [Azonexus sp.]
MTSIVRKIVLSAAVSVAALVSAGTASAQYFVPMSNVCVSPYGWAYTFPGPVGTRCFVPGWGGGVRN